jgi:hypothetical protein
MEKHHIVSEVESCHDIYRNYIRRTEQLQNPVDGFHPKERQEWVAAKRAAKFCSRKISRELKRSKEALALLTPAHYKYARSLEAKSLIEIRLEFALAIQNAIELSKTAQTPYAEKELEKSKENVFKAISAEALKNNGTSTSNIKQALNDSSSNSSTTTMDSIYGENPAAGKKLTVAKGPNVSENSSNDESIPTTLSSQEPAIKPVTDADFEFDNLYNNSANTSKNYTDEMVADIMDREGNRTNENGNRAGEGGKATVQSMSNPLRDKAKSFHMGTSSPSLTAPPSPGSPSSPSPAAPKATIVQTPQKPAGSGNQLANKIHNSEAKHNSTPAPNALLSRSMHSTKLDEEKEKEELARKEAEAAATAAAQQQAAKDKSKGKNPIKSIGKAFGRMFSLASSSKDKNDDHNISPKAASNTAHVNVEAWNNAAKPGYKASNSPKTPPTPSSFMFKLSNDETDRPVTAPLSKQAPVNSPPPAAKPVIKESDHALNQTGNFAELRRIAKQQQQQQSARQSTNQSKGKNELTSVSLQTKSGEMDEPSPRSLGSRSSGSQQSAMKQDRQSQSVSFHQQQQGQPPVQQQVRFEQPIQQPQQRRGHSMDPPSSHHYPTQQSQQHQQPQFYGHHPQQQQQQQMHPQMMMMGSGGHDDLSPKPSPANNVHQLRADKEKFEKVMKITDDLISQAKLTENKYNSNANNWHFISEAWDLCVNYCEKEFDHSVDRFKNDWNRKLTYVIKEKHRWNDKMKRMKEYDQISHYSSSPPPPSVPTPVSEIEREKERRIQQQQALSSSRTPSHSNSAYIPSPNESRSFGTSSPNISMYSVNSTSNHAMKSKSGSTLYDNSKPMSPSSPATPSSSSGPYSGPEPNKLEKLQDKLQRNKVKSILEKALIVTNSAKYELSKKAVHEAKQAWNDVVALYEQSYNNAPPAFRDWWKEEFMNVKKLRDENVAFLIDKMPNNTSMYNVDGGSAMSPSSVARNSVQFHEPGLPVPTLASISSHSSNSGERGINVMANKDLNMSMDMSDFVNVNNQRSPQPVPSTNSSSSAVNNSSNRGNSVNFHRVRVG